MTKTHIIMILTDLAPMKPWSDQSSGKSSNLCYLGLTANPWRQFTFVTIGHIHFKYLKILIHMDDLTQTLMTNT